MHWLIVVITAHALNAVNFVVDKFLLGKSIKDTFVYTFAIGVLGLLVLLLIPFGFEYPGLFLLLVNLFTGVVFIFGLMFFFSSLKQNEASRIVPLIGSSIPIITFFLSFVFLKERLSAPEILAFLFLVLGTYLITQDIHGHQRSLTLKGMWVAFAAAFFFAIAFVLNKYAFNTQLFLSAFIWIRIGSFLAVCVFLVKRKHRKAVTHTWKSTDRKIRTLFLMNQGIGALAFLLISYAISLASVTLVNALQGVQYGILLIFVVFLSRFYPNLLKEKIERGVVLQKTFAVICISFGLFILSWYA